MDRNDDAFTPGRPEKGRDARPDETRPDDGSGGDSVARGDEASADATGADPEDGRPINRNLIYNNPEKWRIGREFLERYTGTAPEDFRKQIILTNFHHYAERFQAMAGDAVATQGSAMAAVHSEALDVSIIDFSIGSPVAALIIEVLATADPKATLFLGICGGLHRSLVVGDFVLPTAAIRDEGASKHFMPPQVPALPTFKIQKFVSQIVGEDGFDYRTGVVHTTDYRFWEFNEAFKHQLYDERALAIDMETATLFSVGFASKVPIGALLLVSDLPLRRGGMKTRESARRVFRSYTDRHIEIGVKAMSEIAERGEHIRHYRW
ncbi:MAG: AMP nucleosidase [Trueperaceae bacterium]|nr:AMP nucleosidase [Trueperaceae bacterium]